ncbi:sn-glycerol-3-phosphate import ATP-binding protein UgpC [Variibacter gotjawalensis]|uniref:sn-glycerol-3-phosphate import ATP-binding protein UgpC n=1 Tax=Variibacter gotjawalensis TaxID=1333996 RepID=A0A0S3PZ64_9BRAD|nr:ABC transporter ATP-binding protein [Variibacter gotjawalensis]NIK47023.1 sn-glycerol 3-phosphate transport system ATP-binding protein [Variibacter gotjawalensis]RZS48928.1 carbohydrate ABC transporter ATP-binding protein (CUT1 family) [Variibacter gotjawalensis]BAT61186.1 sn-glycerol-3-phosphate import ATP-binding protein UgpC [Variibacter gotjawalensis]
MPTILVEGVSRLWGETAAVRDVSFKVEAGSLVALLGPSGCGKSTTLRLIAGLDFPNAGRILIGDRDVTQLPPAKRGIAMVFQSYALFPHLSVAENIIFGLRVRNVDRAERDKRLRDVAQLLGLAPLLERKPSQLSGGQQQRVALARAVVAQAEVCLMDEPLSNLDAQLRLEMRREIRALQQRLGMTMIYVTHDQVEAMTMADRIILMRNGQIEQNGTPTELYASPATTFSARFIGTPPMNVVPATAVASRPIAQTLLGQRSADDIYIGVRPESVRLDDAGVAAEVIAAEYLGADTLLETRVGGAPFVARIAGKTDVARGATVHFAWSPDDQHLFDRKSEQRLV